MLTLIDRLAISALFATAFLGAGTLAQPLPVPEPSISTEQIPLTPDAPFVSELYAFYVEDELFPPSACRTVFVGSSSIRFWLTLEDDFPELNPLNRGFGGAQITEVIGYFDRVLTPHQPKEIIFYAGENDLSAGASPAQVAARFSVFMEMKTDRLGDAPVYFLSAKPSVARAGELPRQTQANQLIRDLAEARSDLTFVDIATPMLEDGQPRPLFLSDQLHMNLDGYAIWTEALMPLLSDPDRPVRTGC